MKNIPIKFRAVGIDGKLYFGDLRHLIAIYVPDEGLREVESETVAQLCGYDIEGNEVYEGDILIDSDNREHKVFLNPAANAQAMRTHTIDKTFVEVFQLKKKGEE